MLLKSPLSSLSDEKVLFLYSCFFFFLTPCIFSTVTFNNITMHSVPVMISTVTQAHTVSEGVGVEQVS